jgi:type II secretory pathway pseudopilin PulG
MKRKNIFHCKRLASLKAFTVVELIISVTIIAIIGSFISVLMLKWVNLWNLSKANSEIQRDARSCLFIINKNLRQCTASTVAIDRLNSSQPPFSRISLFKDGAPVIYYQKGRELYEVTASTRVLARSLRNIQFIYPQTSDSSLISVSATFERRVAGTDTRALQMSIEKVRIMN